MPVVQPLRIVKKPLHTTYTAAKSNLQQLNQSERRDIDVQTAATRNPPCGNLNRAPLGSWIRLRVYEPTCGACKDICQIWSYLLYVVIQPLTGPNK